MAGHKVALRFGAPSALALLAFAAACGARTGLREQASGPGNASSGSGSGTSTSPSIDRALADAGEIPNSASPSTVPSSSGGAQAGASLSPASDNTSAKRPDGADDGGTGAAADGGSSCRVPKTPIPNSTPDEQLRASLVRDYCVNLRRQGCAGLVPGGVGWNSAGCSDDDRLRACELSELYEYARYVTPACEDAYRLDCCFQYHDGTTDRCICGADTLSLGYATCDQAAASVSGQVVPICPQYAIDNAGNAGCWPPSSCP